MTCSDPETLESNNVFIQSGEASRLRDWPLASA
jgi:hypothetical protein